MALFWSGGWVLLLSNDDAGRITSFSKILLLFQPVLCAHVKKTHVKPTESPGAPGESALTQVKKEWEGEIPSHLCTVALSITVGA